MKTLIPERDITRTILVVFFITFLIAISLWILQPFLPVLIWSATIVITTWPLMLRLQHFLWNRRAPATAVMTVIILLTFILPFSLAIGTIVENAQEVIDWARTLKDFRMPAAPAWLVSLPLVGSRFSAGWEQIAAARPEELTARLAPYAGSLVRWFVGQVGSLGMIFLYFLLTVVMAAVLYSRGETAADGVNRFARRIAGVRGEESVRLAAQAIRAVALGVVVTALIQSIIAWIGLAVTGVPHATLLTGLIFILAIAQVGAALPLIPAVIWLYMQHQHAWGTVLLVVAVTVAAIDNLLRPIFIKRGANLPLLLILSGVIGGLIAFGIIGIFIGPVVLAVSYTLLTSWVRDSRTEECAPAESTTSNPGVKTGQ